MTLEDLNRTEVFPRPDRYGLYVAWTLSSDGKDAQFFHLCPDKKTPAYEERYEDVSRFHDGLAVAKQQGQAFHITFDGKPAYSQRYRSVSRFIQGRAQAFTDSGHVMLIKKNDGTIVEASIPHEIFASDAT